MDQLEKPDFQGRSITRYESNWKVTATVMVVWLSMIITLIALSYILK